MRAIRIILACGALALLADVSRADIMFVQGPGNIAGDENVLFNEAGLVSTGNPVQGITNNSGLIVDFLGTENLTTPSGGQARIESELDTFDDLTVQMNLVGATFTSLIFNLNADDDGMATITVTEDDSSQTAGTFDISGNGENFFQVIASNGQLISSVHVATTSQLGDVRQIRIGGAVPEPSTWALAATVFTVMGGCVLRRRQKAP